MFVVFYYGLPQVYAAIATRCEANWGQRLVIFFEKDFQTKMATQLSGCITRYPQLAEKNTKLGVKELKIFFRREKCPQRITLVFRHQSLAKHHAAPLEIA
ncbi:MAG: hypothetical protein SFV81_01305 [Pirellulaceae bacterium]|nr:hypothetical protein [Pirellulaceae bacterium]